MPAPRGPRLIPTQPGRPPLLGLAGHLAGSLQSISGDHVSCSICWTASQHLIDTGFLKTQAQGIGREKRRGNSSAAILGCRHPDKTISQKGCRDSETVRTYLKSTALSGESANLLAISRFTHFHPFGYHVEPGVFYLPLGCLRATKRLEDTQALS